MWQKISKDKRIWGLGGLLLVVAIIPVTLGLTQQQQDIRQHASGPATCSANNPIDAMLLIDKSGSMGPPVSTDDRITPAKAAATNFVNLLNQSGLNNKLGQRSQVGVVSYAQLLNSTQGQTTLDAPLTRLSGQSDVDSVTNKIQAIKVFGRTCTQCAVQLANQEILAHGRSGVKKIVVLMTDGGANAYGTHLTADQSTAEAAANTEVDTGHAQSGTIFFTIGLGTDVNTKFLQSIADRTGGQYFFAPTSADLNQIYQQISTIVGKGSISGSVYNDVNKNKTQDTSESGLAGWKVNLIDPNSQAVIANTTTDTQGNYSFSGICDGTYKATLDVQPRWQLTTPTSPDYLSPKVTNGNVLINQNFGVNQGPLTTTLVCAPTDIQLGTTPQAITATLKDSEGNPVPNETVSFTTQPLATFIGKSPETGKTDSKGQVQFQVSAPATSPDYNGKITLSHANTTNYTASSCSLNAKVEAFHTTISINVFLHGIGNAGDNANTRDTSLSNKNPSHTSRSITINIYDTDNKFVVGTTYDAVYNETTGNFRVTRDLGSSITSGKYAIFVSSPGYLARRIPQIIPITAKQDNSLPSVQLVTGDVGQNNLLNILDYDLITGCYSDFAAPISCNQTQKISTDLNDDGKVDQADYNLFLRELSVQNGDSLDQSSNP